jgi:hypothetical protein
MENNMKNKERGTNGVANKYLEHRRKMQWQMLSTMLIEVAILSQDEEHLLSVFTREALTIEARALLFKVALDLNTIDLITAEECPCCGDWYYCFQVVSDCDEWDAAFLQMKMDVVDGFVMVTDVSVVEVTDETDQSIKPTIAAGGDLPI